MLSSTSFSLVTMIVIPLHYDRGAFHVPHHHDHHTSLWPWFYFIEDYCPNIMVIVPTMMPYFSLSLILTFSLLCLSLFFYSISISSNHARYTQLLSLEQTYSHNPRSAASPLSFGTLAATTYILRRFFISFFSFLFHVFLFILV